MSLEAPVKDGSESCVGFVRESTWGTTPTTGADPDKVVGTATQPLLFLPCKEEDVEGNPNVEPQTDDMTGDREIGRIVDNGRVNEGPIRLTAGPESIGYLLTMLFGTPETSELHATSGSYEGVFQHVWEPGYNVRADWPAFYSWESQMSTAKSKLIQGALLRRLGLDIGNNKVVDAALDLLAKRIFFLHPTADAAKGSGELDRRGLERPAVMTASPVFIDEEPFHFKQVVAYPTLTPAATALTGGSSIEEVTSLSFDLQFLGLDGLFTAGGGRDIGTYKCDNFQLGGNIAMIFEDEELWEDIQGGAYFGIDMTLQGEDSIRADLTGVNAHYNSLRIQAYSCKFASGGIANRVGALEYALPWTARKDPTEGKSCTITAVNTVSSFALP